MITVLVVDDQELVREGLRLVLEAEPDLEVVGEAADGSAASVMRLPNPSTSTTLTLPTGSAGSRTSSSPSMRGPSGISPSARCAATGPNRSRPWNVSETGSSRHGEALTSTTSSIPSHSAAGTSSPLSGPTR